MVRLQASGLILVLLLASAAFAQPAERGILMAPDDDGVFRYREGFSTKRVFTDAFAEGLTLDNWDGSRITNTGPYSVGMVYRFYTERSLRDLTIRVEQQANGPSLGGTNQLFISPNGVDWTLAAASTGQPGDASDWQREPLVLPRELAGLFEGRAEVWVRLSLRNTSGVETNVSNVISSFELSATIGDQPTQMPADPSAAARAQLAAARAGAGYRQATLDLTATYTEAADGLLDRAEFIVTANAPVAVQEYVPFGRDYRYLLIHRGVAEDCARPSVVVFCRTGPLEGSLFVELRVRAIRAGLQTVAVSWDGRPLGTFDARAYFPVVRTETFVIENPGAAGIHELRIRDVTNTDLMRPQFAVIEGITVGGQGDFEPVPMPDLPANTGLRVEAAYYLPDSRPPPDSPAVEPHLTALYETHSEYGSLIVVLHNPGPQPVRIAEPIMLDGLPLESQYVDFKTAPWDARGIAWWRLRPRQLAPGQSAELTIRFRRRPLRDEAYLALSLENGPPLEVTIPYRQPALVVDYVAAAPETQTLYAYFRRSADIRVGRLRKVLLDGRQPREVSLYGDDFPGGVALAVVTPYSRLKPGDYHVIGARTDAGAVIAAQFRVLQPFFPLSAWSPDDRFLAAANRLHMNHLFTSTWALAQELLAPFEARGLQRVAVNSYDTTFRQSPALAGWYLPDEPDAKDAVHWWLWDKSLGRYAREWQKGLGPALERFGAPAPTICLANLTFRPLNWFVYGRVGDIFSTDPYTVAYFDRDPLFVREALSLARQASTPRPLIACLEAFGWAADAEPGVGGPSPEEWRQNFAQAIGVGAKGVTMWYHGRNAGGFEGREEMEQVVAGTYASIEPLLPELILGTPADYSRCETPQVWVGSLVCGPDSIVLAAANDGIGPDPAAENPRYRPPAIAPAQDVRITVQLPRFLQEVEVFEALPQGLQPFTAEQRGRTLWIELDELVDGRLFVLRRR